MASHIQARRRRELAALLMTLALLLAACGGSGGGANAERSQDAPGAADASGGAPTSEDAVPSEAAGEAEDASASGGTSSSASLPATRGTAGNGKRTAAPAPKAVRPGAKPAVAMEPPASVTRPRAKLRAPEPGPSYELSMGIEGGTTYIYATRDGESHVVVSEPTWQLPGLIEKNVALSPDNRTLTYATFERSSGKGVTSHMKVWLVDIDGERKRELLDLPWELWPARPVWSPDSSKLAYVRTQSPGEAARLELWVVNRDGRGNRMLLAHPTFNTGLFYGADERPIRWNEFGDVEYRDHARGIVYTVNGETGALSRRRERLKPPASEIAVVKTRSPIPVQSQNDPRWRFERINTCDHPMGNSGCAITTTSMSFSANGSPATPQSLNEELGNLACPLYWTYASKSYTDGKLELWGSWAFDWAMLDLSLSKGRPAMVMLSDAPHYEDAVLLHWVLVVGGEGREPEGYRIYDPWDGSTYKTLAYYTEKGYGLERVYTYAPKQPKAEGRQGD